MLDAVRKLQDVTLPGAVDLVKDVDVRPKREARATEDREVLDV